VTNLPLVSVFESFLKR